MRIQITHYSIGRKTTACWQSNPEKATDRWADVTCKKCLKKREGK